MIAASPIILHYAFSAITFVAVDNICTFTHVPIIFINLQITKRLMQEKGLFEYFTDCITLKLADFDGRARRREYWGYVLFYSIIAFVFIFIDILLDLGLILPKIVSLIFALPSLAVSVRRLHDVGKPGYYILAGLIPILGAFYLLFLFIEDREPEENAYGPNPKGL